MMVARRFDSGGGRFIIVGEKTEVSALARMFASDPGCKWATVDQTGNRYDADRKGFITVDNSTDARILKAGGYVEAGGVGAYVRKTWVCECGWEALINSCPKCQRTDLTRVDG